MQILSHNRMLCWLLVLLLSGAAVAGVVDDAEEVLTTVRGKGTVSGQSKAGSGASSSQWTSQSSTSSPSTAPKPRVPRGRTRAGGIPRSARPGLSSSSQDAPSTKANTKRIEGRGRGRAINFAALFLLVALVVAAVSYSNQSGESH